MSRRSKTAYQLDTPYTTTQWPKIPLQALDTIVGLLCSLLSPVGRHRLDHIVPSKGRRSRKRKRKEEVEMGEATGKPVIPPPPEILDFIVVGLSNVTRRLEAAAQNFNSFDSLASDTTCVSVNGVLTLSKSQDADVLPNLLTNALDPRKGAGRLFTAIFVSSSSQSSMLCAHLPQLIRSASLVAPHNLDMRLVPLPKGCDDKICSALGVPRASVIGILEGAPHSKALADFITENVPAVDIPWMREAKEASYKPVRINVIETVALADNDKSGLARDSMPEGREDIK